MRDYVHIVLVSGGRDHAEPDIVWAALDAVLLVQGPVCIVTGACPRGVDLYAENWAKKRQQLYMGFPAEWDAYGKAAGMKRNKEMIELSRPNQAVIFSGGPGTANMLELAREWYEGGDLNHLWLPEGDTFK